MASTNPFAHAEPRGRPRRSRAGRDGARLRGAGRARDRHAEQPADTNPRSEQSEHPVTRGNNSRRQRLTQQRKTADKVAADYGLPSWESLRPVIFFLLFPGLLAIGVALTGPWPKLVLYGLAAPIGLYVFISVFRGMELVLACMLLYLPFSTTYVIPIAPGINGTNMLILLGLFASVMRSMDQRESLISWPKGTITVLMFAFLTSLSAFTIMREPGGYAYFMYNELLNYKAWLDQFLLYFIALSCIRSIDIAKRVVLYMCLGTLVLVLYSIPEVLDKMGNSTIDKSRIGGPHQQPNMFGGFVAYTLVPIIAIFVVYIKDLRAWLLTPFFLLSVKVLIMTFSRGAYLAFAAGAVVAGFLKGKRFLFSWLLAAVVVLALFPQLFPQSIKDRLFNAAPQQMTTMHQNTMDDSSETRIVLWRAAGRMILENPILGKGFKGFQKLKSQYTEREVRESDPHSTYFYIGSQMGLPALTLFLIILAISFFLGLKLCRQKDDKFVYAIGIGGASATVCYAAASVFGSRAVNLEYTSYFWTYLACMQIIAQQLQNQHKLNQPKKRRGNAYKTRFANADSGADAVDADGRPLSESTQAEQVPQLHGPSVAGRPGQRSRTRGKLNVAEERKKRRAIMPRGR